MAFCPNCGTEASGAYCPNCGAQIGAAAGSASTGSTSTGSTSTGSTSTGSASGYSSQPGYSSASGASVPRSSGLSQNAASALCYLLGFITGIIFLVLAPYNQDRTVRFHAWQSIFLNIVFIALSIILPAVGHLAGMALLTIVDLAGFILWLYLLFSVFNGKQVRLPVIADWADKQANR